MKRYLKGVAVFAILFAAQSYATTLADLRLTLPQIIILGVAFAVINVAVLLRMWRKEPDPHDDCGW